MWTMTQRRILLVFPGLEGEKLFDRNVRDAVTDPFISLRDRLLERGYRLQSANGDDPETYDWVWFWDAVGFDRPTESPQGLLARLHVRRRMGVRQPRHPSLFDRALQVGLKERLVLFTGEPPTVCRSNWDPAVHDLFPTVFTWNDSLVDQRRFWKFFIPVPGEAPAIPQVPFHCRRLLVAIMGNKTSPTHHPRELYTARRQAIADFELLLRGQFSLHGTGWNQHEEGESFFHSYRGPVGNKRDVYPFYRFGLCYENIRDEPGYISEKIFDCMRGGAVPIYWGASNIADYVEEGAFIDRRAFESNADLAAYLHSISEEDFCRYRAVIQEYLRSQRFARYLPPAFAADIIRVLAL